MGGYGARSTGGGARSIGGYRARSTGGYGLLDLTFLSALFHYSIGWSLSAQSTFERRPLALAGRRDRARGGKGRD